MKDQNITTTSDLLNDIGHKLIGTDTSAQGYWRTVGEFISYRSQSYAKSPQGDLPNCTDHAPQHNFVVGSTTPHTLILNPAVYTHCRVVLDSPTDMDKINEILRRQVLLEFDDCVVVYSGGAVNLPSLEGTPKDTFSLLGPNGEEITRTHIVKNDGPPRLQFNSCLFIFSVHDTPPPAGKILTRTLLAQDGPLSIVPLPKG